MPLFVTLHFSSTTIVSGPFHTVDDIRSHYPGPAPYCVQVDLTHQRGSSIRWPTPDTTHRLVGARWLKSTSRRTLRLIVHLGRSSQIALLLQIADDDLHGILDTRLVRADVDLGLERLLIRRADARELWDLALSRLLVQALGIALLGDFDGDVDPDFHERHAGFAARTLRLVQLAREVAVAAVRADEARDGDGAGVGEELGDLGDAADVFFAVLRGEAEVLVEPEADVVAVQAVGGFVVGFAQESLLERDGDGRFAACTQPCEPDREAGLFAEAGADAGRQGCGVVMDVAFFGPFVSLKNLIEMCVVCVRFETHQFSL